jgi:hypothetical protein
MLAIDLAYRVSATAAQRSASSSAMLLTVAG